MIKEISGIVSSGLICSSSLGWEGTFYFQVGHLLLSSIYKTHALKIVVYICTAEKVLCFRYDIYMSKYGKKSYIIQRKLSQEHQSIYVGGDRQLNARDGYIKRGVFWMRALATAMEGCSKNC